MRSTKSFLWLVVLSLSPFSLHAEVKYASFPALGVELPQPEGYVVSKQWSGLENPAKLVGIQITTMPASFAEASAGFTPQQMAAAHMQLHQRSEATIAGKKALMIQLTQAVQDIEVGKWIAIYGDETNTTMLVATFPLGDNELSEEIKAILTGARSIEVKRRPLGENVDFKVGETRKLRIASDFNNTLIYTLGGAQKQQSPTDPLFLVSKTADVLPPGDIRGQLQQGLLHLAETTITHNDAIQNVDLGPNCRACEVTATGEHKPTGTKRVIYERLIAYPDCCYLIVGIVGAKQGDEFLPEFQNMANGFSRNSPIESGAVATTSAPGSGPRGPGFSQRPFAGGPSIGARPGGRRDTGAGDEAAQASASRPRRVFKPGEPWEFYDIEDERRDEAERGNRGASSTAESGRKRAATKRDSHSADSRIGMPAKPQKAIPEFQYASDGIHVSGQLGSQNGKQFSASAPSGGILVGLRVSRGDSFGGSVRAIAPIFQVKGRYVSGKPIGEGGDGGQILLAPPGFAVGGVQVGSGLWMDALRLIYMPLEGNKLDVAKREYSEWVGGRGGGTKEIVSDGGLIVGVVGSFKENIESLQLMYVASEDLKSATSSTAESSGSSPDQELRTWKSASGKFTITARLESVDGTEVKLVTQDGRHISVAIEKLSAEDQKHIKESEKEAENPFKVENSVGQPSK
jgi:hypothetical protein